MVYKINKNCTLTFIICITFNSISYSQNSIILNSIDNFCSTYSNLKIIHSNLFSYKWNYNNKICNNVEGIKGKNNNIDLVVFKLDSNIKFTLLKGMSDYYNYLNIDTSLFYGWSQFIVGDNLGSVSEIYFKNNIKIISLKRHDSLYLLSSKITNDLIYITYLDFKFRIIGYSIYNCNLKNIIAFSTDSCFNDIYTVDSNGNINECLFNNNATIPIALAIFDKSKNEIVSLLFDYNLDNKIDYISDNNLTTGNISTEIIQSQYLLYQDSNHLNEIRNKFILESLQIFELLKLLKSNNITKVLDFNFPKILKS